MIALKEKLTELSRKIGRTANAHELLIKLYEDPDVPIDIRKEAAATAIRYEKPALSLNDKALLDLIKPDGGRTVVNLDNLAEDERALLAKLMGKVTGKAMGDPPMIESQPTFEANPRFEVSEPRTPDLSDLPSREAAEVDRLRAERAELLAELARHESPEEIVRLRDEWPSSRTVQKP